MNRLLQDFNYSIRMLAKTPSTTAIAVFTLALGIGANAAIFSVVNEALLRPRPGIGAPDRLVDIGRDDGGRGFDNMSYPNFRDYRDRNGSLSGAAALMLEPRPLSLATADGGSERIYANLVSGNYFDVLQVKPCIGRFFLPEEDRTPGTNPVVVLSHRYWTQKFHSDRSIVGRSLTLNGLGFAVVGVASPDFHGTSPLAMDVWIPMMMSSQVLASQNILECRECSFMVGIGRLRDGATLKEARAEARAISAGLESEFPRQNKGRGVTVTPSRLFPGELADIVGAFLGPLMAIVGLVLVIASVNVAGMMLVRASARRREIAVRLAVGAKRGQIARQFLVEGSLVFVAGGCAGLLLAVWMRNALLALLPVLPFPIVADLNLDWRVVAFALGISLLAGAAASLVPAVQASHPDVLSAMRGDAQSGGLNRMSLRSALVLGQVSLSLVLLICAGLFLRALDRAAKIDPGFDMNGLYVFSMDLSLAGLADAEGTDFANRFAERVRVLPGVSNAGWTWSVPLDGGGRGLGAFQVPGTTSPAGSDQWDADWSVITPGYFGTMRLPLVRGRDFTEDDTASARPVAIINEHAARQIWPGQDPVGKTFRTGNPREPAGMRTVEIVGVARDQKYRSLGDPPRNFVFVPLRQQYIANLGLMVRTSNPAVALPAIRSALRDMNPRLPVLNVLSMREYAALSMFPQKIASWVSGSLGLAGLLLVGLGVYGVTAFSVAQRTREIGVRMALGAERSDVLRMVFGQGLRLAGWGVGLGLVVAGAAAQLLSALLYGISALDPLAFGAAALTVIGVAASAILTPARRATRVDPIVALRET
jgi:predicted permease